MPSSDNHVSKRNRRQRGLQARAGVVQPVFEAPMPMLEAPLFEETPAHIVLDHAPVLSDHAPPSPTIDNYSPHDIDLASSEWAPPVVQLDSTEPIVFSSPDEVAGVVDISINEEAPQEETPLRCHSLTDISDLPSPMNGRMGWATPRPDQITDILFGQGSGYLPSQGADLTILHSPSGELAAPSGITAAAALGSIASKQPGRLASTFPTRQSGVYVHSLPSASDPEVPTSPSDSEDEREIAPTQSGHISTPIIPKAGPTPSVTLDSIASRIRRGTSSSSRRPIIEKLGILAPNADGRSTSATFPPSVSNDAHSQASPDLDAILWTQWGVIETRRYLILGYRTSVQMWNVSHLELVQEVLHLTDFGEYRPRAAALLPSPGVSDHSVDDFIRSRPMVALLLSSQGQDLELRLYALTRHVFVHKRGLPIAPGASVEDCSLSASESFVIVNILADTHEACVYILSAFDLSYLYTIPLPSSTTLPSISLSRRLLAVPSHAPVTEPLTSHPRSTIQSSSENSRQDAARLAGSVAMDVATTARRVGEGVWGGFSAAASSAWSGLTLGEARSTVVSPAPAPSRWSFSRSAPTSREPGGDWISGLPIPVHPLRTKASLHHPPNERNSSSSGQPASAHSPIESRGWVSVYDLHPLLMGPARSDPKQIARFPFISSRAAIPPSSSSASPITRISFSPSGALLALADSDGGLVKVFQLRAKRPDMTPQSRESIHQNLNISPHSLPQSLSPPSPRMTKGTNLSSTRRRRQSSASSASNVSSSTQDRASAPVDGHASTDHADVWHVYDLSRGVTRANIQNIQFSADECWIGVGTEAGTLHIFAINPFGGKPEPSSHIDGRIRNIREFQPLSTVLHPITRIHTHPPATTMQAIPPDSFIFSILTPSASTGSIIPNTPGNAQPINPYQVAQPPREGAHKKGVQDFLIMTASTKILSLYRSTIISQPAKPHSDTSTADGSRDRTNSTSLPTSGLTRSMMRAVQGDKPLDRIKAQEKLLASWNVGKSMDWSEVYGSNFESDLGPLEEPEADWLSEAELSTSTNSLAMLPGPIYLSHQFSFFSLTDDWHAPLRRTVLDLPCSELEVRKQVEISAFTPNTRMDENDSEAFYQGGSKGLSPFDEPLASAIHARIDRTLSDVIPSYPNGLRSSPGNWIDAAPLRYAAVNISDGVGEGLGRLKRELGKVAKSPIGGKHAPMKSIPTAPGDSLMAGADNIQLGAPDLINWNDSLGVEDLASLDFQDGWNEEDDVEQTVAEHEAFEHIGVVGEMDEDRIMTPDAKTTRKRKKGEGGVRTSRNKS